MSSRALEQEFGAINCSSCSQRSSCWPSSFVNHFFINTLCLLSLMFIDIFSLFDRKNENGKSPLSSIVKTILFIWKALQYCW